MTEDGKRKQVQEFNKVQDLIAKIVLACKGRDAVFRGEPRQYGVPASSRIYRRYGTDDVFNDYFGPADIEREIVAKARSVLYADDTPEMHILTDLRHFGGDTNLVDFSEALPVALFFACNVELGEDDEDDEDDKDDEDDEDDEDGRVLVLHKDCLGTHGDGTIELVEAARTEQSRNRVAAQASIFVRPRKGHVDKKLMTEIRVPKDIKMACLEYLDRFHNIRQQTIYNDLAGFIENEENFASASAEFYKGTAKAKLGDYGDAIGHYDAAIRLRPESSDAFNNRGVAKAALRKHADAIKDFDAAIRWRPKDAQAFTNRGAAKVGLGKYEEAIGKYEDAIGKYEDAIKDHDEAIRLRTDLPEAFTNRGAAREALGEPADAIKDYGEAIRLRPDFPQAFLNRGAAKADLGQHGDAIGDYDEAIRLRPEYAEAFFNRGNAKLALDKPADAIGDYDEAIRLRPEYAEAFANRGNAKLALDKPTDAIEDFDKAIRLRPKDPKAFIGRGNAKAALGEYVDARADYARALDLAERQGNAALAKAIRAEIERLDGTASPDP